MIISTNYRQIYAHKPHLSMDECMSTESEATQLCGEGQNGGGDTTQLELSS